MRLKDRGCKYASTLGEDGTKGEEICCIDACDCKAKNLIILQQYQIIFNQDFSSVKKMLLQEAEASKMLWNEGQSYKVICGGCFLS